MTDRELLEALHRLDRPIEPDPAFADALFVRLHARRRSRGSPRIALLVAAALLLAAAISGALIVGSSLLRQRTIVPGMFTPVGPMVVHRDWAASAVLADGRVVVVGGIAQDTEPGYAALFDPTSRTFGSTGSMSTPRTSPTATALADGRILVVGGSHSGADGSQVTVASADVFDAATGRFAPTGGMAHARAGHTATLLADGGVLVTGGSSVGASPRIVLSSAEVYDTSSGTWSEVGPMPQARVGHMAVRLDDGRVLIVGGSSTGGPEFLDGGSAALASALVFDPGIRSFEQVGSMAVGRRDATATRLQDGRVLVAGGNAGTGEAPGQEAVLASAELFDPATGTFSRTGSLTTERRGHSATVLGDGQVLVAGGSNEHGRPHSAEIFDPGSGVFRVATTARGDHDGLAALLPDGEVLLADGDQPELFNPAGDAPFVATATGADPGFTVTGPPITDRTAHTGTRLLDGRVLIAGGLAIEGRQVLASAEIYDPRAGTFSATGSLAEPRSGHAALLLDDGRVLIAGGTGTRDVPLTTIELFDPATGRFAVADPLVLAVGPESLRSRVRLAQLANGRVVVIGPTVSTGQDYATMVSELDPANWSIVRRSELTGCSLVDAVALSDHRIIVVCSGPTQGVSSLRMYEPATGASVEVGSYEAHSFPNSVVALPDGRALVVNVGGPTNLVVFDPRTGVARETGSPHDADAATDAFAALLADGRVLLDGVDAVWTFDPATGATARVATPGVLRQDATLTRLDDGRVLMVGGAEWPADRTMPRPPGAELFDPATTH
jgi:hypothetical protein